MFDVYMVDDFFRGIREGRKMKTKRSRTSRENIWCEWWDIRCVTRYILPISCLLVKIRFSRWCSVAVITTCCSLPKLLFISSLLVRSCKSHVPNNAYYSQVLLRLWRSASHVTLCFLDGSKYSCKTQILIKKKNNPKSTERKKTLWNMSASHWFDQISSI